MNTYKIEKRFEHIIGEEKIDYANNLLELLEDNYIRFYDYDIEELEKELKEFGDYVVIGDYTITLL